MLHKISFKFSKTKRMLRNFRRLLFVLNMDHGFGCNSHEMFHFFFQTLTQKAFIRLTYSNTTQIVELFYFLFFRNINIGFISADQTANVNA